MSTLLVLVNGQHSGKTINITITSVDLSDNLINDSTRLIFQWVFYTVISQLICLFGTVTNIINIICFVKIGFKDPVNISLLGLSFSDLGCLVTLTWTNICYNPAFNELEWPFDPIEVQYLTGAWPHASFARITSWITAFIALERCLCITVPLKVKTIITPKRVTIMIISIFVVLIASVSPLYYANRFGMRYSQVRNTSILGLIFTDDRETVELISFTINNGFIPLSAFLTVIICTITLVTSLRIKTKWRQTSTGSGEASNKATRDQKLSKMIVCISILFIFCFLPICIIIVALVAEPELSIDGKYRNTLIAVCSVGFTLEAANSASNIFIYYYMSSRYGEAFRHLFKLTKT